MSDKPQLPAYIVRDLQTFSVPPEVAAARDRGELPRTTIAMPALANPFPGGVIEAWLVTRHEDVRAVLADHRRFSNDIKNLRHNPGTPRTSPLDSAPERKANLQRMDPPEHTAFRQMLMPAFTTNRTRQREANVSAVVADCLDAVRAQGPNVDLIEHFALPVPSLVICELLGVPYDDHIQFQQRARQQTDVTRSDEERLEIRRASHSYLKSLVERARERPGDDLLGTLVRDHGDKLDNEELTSIGELILLAGHQSTAGMLGLCILTLLLHPDQAQWLRENPDRVESAVEELLRYLTAISAGPARIATEDVEIRGTRISAGELVLLSELAANRDPAFVTNPDELDLSRPPSSHVALGHGAHLCLGAALARLQLRIALTALFEAFPTLELAVPADQLRFHEDFIVFGVKELPVTWRA
ncbi:cytochrome P450 [Saccharopolyspora spinosa]|uniref:Cytochrome P450 n=1 Tax=Saccharopolyspora spinosa TaxID=60894 RepID=A0A2N3Y5B4_SACSN|nr:cytochrome P450 [Saccharopolyspora spinosa]PKW18122.1 cytochrome P450 [Saccharopolyspora spinosa]